jgi:hypothetical protein
VIRPEGVVVALPDRRLRPWVLATLVATWRRAVPFEHAEGLHRHLAGRGIDPGALARHPAGPPEWRLVMLPWRGRLVPTAAAPIVGPGVPALPPATEVTAAGGPGDRFVGLHLTALDPATWRARDHRTHRAAEGAQDGSRVALWAWPPDGDLLVAEGIEDALAVAVATGRPCVAAGPTGAVERLAVPEGRRLVVYADDDPAGRRAAEALRRRLGPWRCEVRVPRHR